MGTRHLIAVVKDGSPKIAQYGQWDGYPSGQGLDVLRFLRSLYNDTVPGLTERFHEAVSRCRFAKDDAELQRLWDDPAYRDAYLSRDVGSDILDRVQTTKHEVILRNSYDFAADGLMCEWAYVIDLDAGALEVYCGYGRGDPPEGERFHGLPRASDGYGAVRLAKSYPLSSLPDEAAFVAELEPQDEDA